MKKKILYLFMVLAITIFQFAPTIASALSYELTKGDTVNSYDITTDVVTLYIGDITVDGTSELKYLYTDKSVNTETLNEIKKILTGDYATMLPTVAGQVKVSNDETVDVDETFTDAGLIAETLYPDATEIEDTSSTLLYSETDYNNLTYATSQEISQEASAEKDNLDAWNSRKTEWEQSTPEVDFVEQYVSVFNDSTVYPEDEFFYADSLGSPTTTNVIRNSEDVKVNTYPVNRTIIKVVNTSCNVVTEEEGLDSASYTITFDLNGGKEKANYPLVPITIEGSSFVLPELPEYPEIDYVENGRYISVIFPEGKVFDTYEVDGEIKEPGEEIEITKDTVIKYLWEDVIYIHKINVTLEAPIVGTKVEAEYDEDEEQYDDQTQTNRPIVNIVGEDDNYMVYDDATYWYDDATEEVFVGEIEKDTTYNASILFVGIDNQYQFADDLKVFINGEEVTDFENMGFGVDVLYSIDSIEVNEEEYNVVSYTDSGDSISFKAPEGDVYSFDIHDIKDLTDEEIQEIVDLFDDPEMTFEIVKDAFNKLAVVGKKAAGEKGTLLKLYEIYLYNNGEEVHEVNGGFKLKIKVTDDMKGYNSFELVYIDEDGNTETPIKLTKNGDYLEGELPHLSTYALIGSNEGTTPASENPKTGDRVMFYVSLLGLSTIGLAGTGLYMLKKKNN